MKTMKTSKTPKTPIPPCFALTPKIALFPPSPPADKKNKKNKILKNQKRCAVQVHSIETITIKVGVVRLGRGGGWGVQWNNTLINSPFGTPCGVGTPYVGTRSRWDALGRVSWDALGWDALTDTSKSGRHHTHIKKNIHTKLGRAHKNKITTHKKNKNKKK